jgi:hypothetical protein
LRGKNTRKVSNFFVKATTTVWQTNLASISNFWQNKKNWPPTFWQTNLAKIKTWQNSPPHAHIGSWLSSAFPCRWESEKRNKEQWRIPDVSFQEVEEHKHNFVSLRIPDVN